MRGGRYSCATQDTVGDFGYDDGYDKGELGVHFGTTFAVKDCAGHVVSRFDLLHDQCGEDCGLKDCKDAVLEILCGIADLPVRHTCQKCDDNVDEETCESLNQSVSWVREGYRNWEISRTSCSCVW